MKSWLQFLFAAFTLGFVMFLGAPWPGQAAPPQQGPSNQDLIRRLNQESAGTVRISIHAETGQVRFIGTSPGQAIRQPAGLGLNATPAQAGRGFLETYGKLFGLQDPAGELTVLSERTLNNGRAFVRFQQVYQTIPIFGGELIVQSDARHNIISANGEIVPGLDLNITPGVSPAAARQNALAKIAKDHGLDADELEVADPELWIYNPALLDGPGQPVNRLVWRTEVTPNRLLPIRELVLVDAETGIIVLHFNQIHMAKNRTIYDNNNMVAFGLPGNGPVRLEGEGVTGVSDADLAYDFAGDTYDFYLDEHGRDSLDDAGLGLISTVRYCQMGSACPFANAFWNGTQMVYGDGFSAADDVVGHELTHGVTEFTSHLFYFYQSGAINESFSDVWGEFIDQTNGAGDDSAGVKWLLGEDVPGFGALRDMEDPPTFGDPDRMLSANYACNDTDSGGVHTNSGVNNKAAFLMTDGGSFNGQTVTGLGITKVADLYYEVQTNLLTSGSNYSDLYDALIQASINLGYSSADQQAISATLAAVEMAERPCSDPEPATICPALEQPDDLFFDDLENTVSGNWASAADLGVNAWFYPQTSNPFSFDATYASSGIYNFWGYNWPQTADFSMAMTSDVAIPANAFMHFRHDYAFEDFEGTNYDGGVIEYSTNGGTTWLDAGSLIEANGYNGVIVTPSSNPLSGQSAFTQDARGYTASRLNLSSLAGQDVRFRFRIGTDPSVADFGWFIDDVRIYTCMEVDIPTFSEYFPLILKDAN